MAENIQWTDDHDPSTRPLMDTEGVCPQGLLWTVPRGAHAAVSVSTCSLLLGA